MGRNISERDSASLIFFSFFLDKDEPDIHCTKMTVHFNVFSCLVIDRISSDIYGSLAITI